MHKGFKGLVVLAVASVGLAGCAVGGSSQSSGDGDTLKVVYWDSGGSSAVANRKIIENAKETFEADNPDMSIQIVPIQAGEGDYATKLALQYRSADTAPDIVYEDTYRLGA